MDLVTKLLCCKATYAINFATDLTVFDVGELFLLSSLPKPQTLVCAPEKGHLSQRTVSLTNIMYLTLSVDCLKVYHQILSDPGMKKALMVLTLYIPFYHFPGLNVKILDKSLGRISWMGIWAHYMRNH